VGLNGQAGRVAVFLFTLAAFACAIGALAVAVAALAGSTAKATLLMNLILLLWVLVSSGKSGPPECACGQCIAAALKTP
jgi:hypothetical protein